MIDEMATAIPPAALIERWIELKGAGGFASVGKTNTDIETATPELPGTGNDKATAGALTGCAYGTLTHVFDEQPNREIASATALKQNRKR